MAFALPEYTPPDFNSPSLLTAPVTTFAPAPADEVAPDNFHATSIFPEYYQLEKGGWRLPEKSRMDCAVVKSEGGVLLVKEMRRLKEGESVACGRRENGEDGIFVHTGAFSLPEQEREKFAFRSSLTRESSFSLDYDELYELLQYEREEGFVLWVLGPAVVFDRDARAAFASLIEAGYIHGLFAGNALPTHDIEGGLYGTALGRTLYSKQPLPAGHYCHLDTINRCRKAGGMARLVEEEQLGGGVMPALIRSKVPYVLAGSIRDDGPLPEVVTDVCRAQDAMRALTDRATTVIALATQLHTIATGNMVPSYRVMADGRVRPVYFYSVDMSEFAVSKLVDRGSLSSRAILTNVQDFIVTLQRRLTAPPQ